MAKTAKKTWLNGLTILDLSSLLPAPFAAHLLEKSGAKVFKIESPNRPDPAREFGYVPPGQTSSCYRELNTGKELVWLDLKTEADRKKLYEMVKTADGLIEGYRPDVRVRLGIEYERLAAINPRLVYCSIMGYASDGPYRDRGGHDINFVARSGILDQTRDENGHCVMPGLPIGDYIVAQAAAFRMASALHEARRTGKGTHVEVFLEEALREVQMPFLREAQESGHAPTGGDTLVTGKYPCYRLYRVGKGTFAVGALEEKFWVAFCNAIGTPELIAKQYAVGAEAKDVGRAVEKALSKKPFEEWTRILTGVDCCVEPVLTLKEVVDGL